MLLNTKFNQRAIVKGCKNKETAIKSTNEFNRYSRMQCICASTYVSIDLSFNLLKYMNDDTYVYYDLDSLMSVFAMRNISIK